MKESAVQIARKQRHILLLQKVKDNKPLTPKEVQELEGYEAKYAAAQAAAENPPSALRKLKAKPLKLMEASVRQAALECESIEAAAEKLGVADLESLLTGKPKLAAAWERGRFLRQVRIVGLKGIVAEEADRFFEPALGRGELCAKLKRDRALHDVWTSAALEAKLAVREGLIQRARRGEADVKVMELYERLLLDGPEAGNGGQIDWHDLTPTQLEKATGIARIQWRRWEEKNGCPRKANRRYSLPAVIAWLRVYEDTGGVKLEQGLNPMQAEKLRRYKLENDEAEGQLLPRADVAKILTQRAARLRELLSEARAQEWSQAHEGKTAAQLKPLYLEAFRQARLAWKDVPEDLPLPEPARAKIAEALALLVSE
jgi:hypothetical protein